MNRFWKLFLANPQSIFIVLYMSCKLGVLHLMGIRTIVYNIHHDYFFDIFEPVCKKLNQHPKVKIFFSYDIHNKRLTNYLIGKCQKLPMISSKISPFLPFKLFICPEVTGPDFPVAYLKTKKIQIYHGTGVYNLYEKTEVLKRFDIHFAIGPQYLEFIEYAYKNEKIKPKIYEVGYPKLDVLTHSNQFPNKLKEIYDLKKRLTILYAPHWNEFSSIFEFQESILESLAHLDANILVKPHNYLFVENSEWEQRFQQVSQKYDNIRIVARPNTQELFPISDIMITDTGTTAALEFSVLQKPLFIYCRMDWFEVNKNSQVESDLCDTSICFESVEELVINIEKILNKNSEMTKVLNSQKSKQNELIKNYLFNLGSATEISFKTIMHELGLQI